MKKFLTLALSLLIAVSLLSTTAAAASTLEPQPQAQSQVEPRVNQVVWVHRTYNGKEQKRLWSYTYQMWMTDWIDC